MIYPTRVVLLVADSGELPRKIGRRLKALGGRYSRLNPSDIYRFVYVPACETDMIDEILSRWKTARSAAVQATYAPPAEVGVVFKPRSAEHIFASFRRRLLCALEDGWKPSGFYTHRTRIRLGARLPLIAAHLRLVRKEVS